MNKKIGPRRISRRNFLKLGTSSALLAALGGGALSTLGRSNPLQAAPSPPQVRPEALQPPERPNNAGVNTFERLGVTDGFISLPGRLISEGNGLYIFGFVRVPTTDTIGQVITDYKGQVQMPAPILPFDEEDNVYLTITNLGLLMRPDLDDAHTIHWHGFRNPVAVFDGVPEVSISVPVGRDFPYFFKPRGAGSYLYHCHFEDVEHVQMGMDGIVYVRPLPRELTDPDYVDPDHHAYDDASTYFDREYTLLFNEIDTRPHDNLLAVQEFVWSDYKANYWVINGRSYPHTIVPDHELTSDLAHQPVSSLIQALPGEKILLRMGHLGYEQHAIQLLGIPMNVVGHDASFLDSQAYTTNTIYIGPGENRDVIFEAPAYNSSLPGDIDNDDRPYNVYMLRNRNYHRLVNGDTGGPGGMMTEVRVYADATALGTQTSPNQTFPVPPSP